MSGQNRSSAVMQQRAEADDSLDDFPTAPWAVRALMEHLSSFARWGIPLVQPTDYMREPAANRGFMVKALREYCRRVEAADVHDYGCGFAVKDYLWGEDPAPVDWTFTNPPFRLAEEFIARMIRTSRVGCGVIVRSAFLEGQDRYESLFSKHPPTMVLQHVERVVMHKATLRRPGQKYIDADGNVKTASTATAYTWLVWVNGMERQPFDWIPPCRLELEREGDYPPEISPVPVDVGGLFDFVGGDAAVENLTGEIA
jgi:hypothetical protein